MSPILSRLPILNKRIACLSNQATLKSYFHWDIPEKFNFAQDVIDVHAKDSVKSNLTALHHMSKSTGNRKWTFQNLSNDSKNVASALLSLGKISRALIMLPRIPEWWILNIAAMRTGTILLPGTTQLTKNDIESRLFMSKADAVIVDKVGAEKIEAIDNKVSDFFEQSY